MKRKGITKIQSFIEEHMKQTIVIYTFVSVLLLIGVVFGAIVVNSLHVDQKQDLLVYMERFLGQVDGKKMIGEGLFYDAFTSHIQYIIFIWLLGISMIGLPIIFVLVFLKGVVIGFTVGFFVNQLGLKGFYLAVVSILPQNLFIVPVLIIMSSVAINFSIKLIKQLFIKHGYDKIRVALLNYTLIFGAMAIVVLIPSFIEVYFSPFAIERILSLYH